MKLTSAWTSMSPERRGLIGEVLRYLITGGVVTLCQAAIYWGLAEPLGIHPQIANLAGYAAAVLLGYFLHGAITFRGRDRVGSGAARGVRFVLVSLLSLGLNALWVWLTVTRIGGPTWAPIPLMIFVTPVAIFTLNRHWVFR